MSKSLSQQFLDEVADIEVQWSEPLSTDMMLQAWEKKIAQFGLSDCVFVEEVEVLGEGQILVTFSDEEGDLYPVVFSYALGDGAQAYLKGEDDEESDLLVAELSHLNPAVTQSPQGEYLNLADLSWLDMDSFVSMLRAMDMDLEIQKVQSIKQDEFGYFLECKIDEVYRTVVKGGKKVRVPLIRRLRKKRLTPRQRAGLRKAAIKRKAKKAQASRKRKRSLALRKRLHLRTQKVPKGFRVVR